MAASDPGDVLTYSLSGADASAFSIDRASGQLRTKAKLDFEDDTNTDQQYVVTVTATDPFGVTATADVTIEVTDVNEDPSVSGAASIDHEEGGTELDADADTNGVQDATYTASDPDADDSGELELTLEGADKGKFNLSDVGLLAFKAAPDFESPGDSDENNVYEVTVVVTDTKDNTDRQDVTVKVTNMEETGTLTLSTLQPRVGFPVTATLEDPDNYDPASLKWQWSNDEGAIEDATSATYMPVVSDIGDTLDVTATYTDGKANEGDAKDTADASSANTVLADTRNKAPVFPDQDTEMDGEQTDQERTVEENTDSDTDIVGAVTATDFITATDGGTTLETLTYSLGGTDAGVVLHRPDRRPTEHQGGVGLRGQNKATR